MNTDRTIPMCKIHNYGKYVAAAAVNLPCRIEKLKSN